MKLIYEIKNNDNFFNIKEVLKSQFKISDRLLTKLKLNKKIYYNSNVCNNIKLTPNNGDIIEIDLNYDEDNSNIVPTKMNLNILFEDEGLLIINKPARITCSSFYFTL